MAKPGQQPSVPNGAYCNHHKAWRAESDLSPRNRHNVLWYRAKRAWLIAELGGKCVECGASEELEFDHTSSRDWEPRKKNRWQRLRLYIRDWKRGEIVLRCRSCNGRKGYPDGQLSLPEGTDPF